MDVLDVDELVKICVSNEQKAAELLARIGRREPQPQVSIKRAAPEELSPSCASDSWKPRPRICKKGKKVRKAKMGSLSEPGRSSSEPQAQARDTSVEWIRLLPSWRSRGLRCKTVPDAPGGDAPPPPPLLPLGGEQDANANPPAVAPPLPPPLLPLIGAEADPLPVAPALPAAPSAEPNARPSISERNPLQLDLNQLPPPENEVPAAAEAAAGPPHTFPLPEPRPLPSNSSPRTPSPFNPNRLPPSENEITATAEAAAPPLTESLPAASATPTEPSSSAYAPWPLKPIKFA